MQTSESSNGPGTWEINSAGRSFPLALSVWGKRKSDDLSCGLHEKVSFRSSSPYSGSSCASIPRIAESKEIRFHSIQSESGPVCSPLERKKQTKSSTSAGSLSGRRRTYSPIFSAVAIYLTIELEKATKAITHLAGDRFLLYGWKAV